ncbi:MAG: pentapeptide repeat-containing protein, partial [Caldilineaceae bacterium]|nr:pentapeptide repeat-containing protein [Caldilineaceae bacterium]
MSSRLVRLFYAFGEWFTIGRFGVFLLLIAIPGGILNYLLAHPRDGDWLGLIEDFYANLSWELTGIAVTILIIDRLYQRAEMKRDQAQLLRQLHSHDHMIVLQALDLLRINGWLEDGLLVNLNLADTDLHQANLRHADLRHAVLRNTNLCDADLRDANLAHADLQDANLEGALLNGATIGQANLHGAKLAGAQLYNVTGLTDEQLATLETLAGAHWNEIDHYDGRFNLTGDQHRARLAGYPLADPTAMARFYQVPLAVYLAGRGLTNGSVPVRTFQEEQ